MKVLIGCPIYKRAWILNHWIRCINQQSIDVSDIGFIFETGPNDEETLSILNAWKKLDKRIQHFELLERSDITHHEHIVNGRNWTVSRYENMVSLRNSLLKRARELQPDYYFSLDSDILIENQNTIELLIAHIKSGADAVSPLMFMTPHGDLYPSVMNWRNDGSNKAMRYPRYPLGSYFQSDVIMAAKMMSKQVYNNVSYSIHEQGEDVGWSFNAKQAGYKLFSASYIYAPHIMSEAMYHQYIQTGDNRPKQYNLEHA